MPGTFSSLKQKEDFYNVTKRNSQQINNLKALISKVKNGETLNYSDITYLSELTPKDIHPATGWELFDVLISSESEIKTGYWYSSLLALKLLDNMINGIIAHYNQANENAKRFLIDKEEFSSEVLEAIQLAIPEYDPEKAKFPVHMQLRLKNVGYRYGNDSSMYLTQKYKIQVQSYEKKRDEEFFEIKDKTHLPEDEYEKAENEEKTSFLFSITGIKCENDKFEDVKIDQVANFVIATRFLGGIGNFDSEKLMKKVNKFIKGSKEEKDAEVENKKGEDD